ncbi:MAG: DUF58 domain-containing protein, partial [Acidobacteriota bacterium]
MPQATLPNRRPAALTLRLPAGIGRGLARAGDLARRATAPVRGGAARLGTRWRLTTRLRQLRDTFPLTLRGVVLLGLAATAFVIYGRGALDLVLYVIALAAFAIAGLGLLLTVATALWLHRHLRLRRHLGADDARANDDARARDGEHGGGDAPLHLEVGRTSGTGFRPRDAVLLPLVQVRWRWLEPSGMASAITPRRGRLHETVTPSRRGLVTGVTRELAVQDVLGLFRVRWRQHDPATAVTVLPDPGRLRTIPTVQALRAAEGIAHPHGQPEGDRMDIRRYVPGDPPRHLLWKTYARTRQLNVRIPERSVEPSRKTIAYLLTGDADEPAAAAARVALEQRALGEDWRFGADGTPRPVTDLAAARAAIARSAGADVEPGLRAFLAR